ncbi:hypothetical protein [Paraburkholderia caribensis]|uniref:hypothetical protein n=1 Tax=Paraburkholderia caribensis TaxID=75105 RepID=UPI002860340D|nr:hypothetical protein [Paraburkholderia caribensis]MDR6381811.1 hypothetical protein [Paraburkholderia caribensis]
MSRNWPDADDPAIVLQRKQRACCHGCRFLEQDRTPGFEKFTCRKGMRKAAHDLYETERCPRYSEKKAAHEAAKKITKRPHSKARKKTHGRNLS